MEITEVRLRPTKGQGRVNAYASVTFDNQLVVHDIKILSGRDGWFLAMPSRQAIARCETCGRRNAVLARYCQECGNKNVVDIPERVHWDIAHPIKDDFRNYVEKTVLDQFDAWNKAGQPEFV